MLRNLLITAFFAIPALGSFAAEDGAAIYQLYCVECHGAKLEGNKASPLIKQNWLYGRTPKYFRRNITHGIPNTEMIAWGKVLSAEQIEALVQFLIDAQSSPPNISMSVPENVQTEDYDLEIEVLVDDKLGNPWGIEFIDERKALVTEKAGRLRWLIDGKLDSRPIDGLPPIFRRGGLMDIALDPNYAENGWVYLAHGHTPDPPEHEKPRALTRIIRGKIDGYRWVDTEVLFQVPEDRYHAGGNRWGGRLLFDRDGYLYFSIGDMARGMASQDFTTPNGKSYRIGPDGKIPDDNPFVGKPRAIEAIFTLGNRNIQGLALHPETGDIWITEHGPMGGDELNILKLGNNYGWPIITYGKAYNGEVVSTRTHQEGMEQPITQWTPSIAVCPAEFVSSPLFSKWKNNLLVGALAYEELRRLVIEDNQVVEQELLFKGYGRVRDVKFGPDGALYVLLNSPGSVLRIVPES